MPSPLSMDGMMEWRQALGATRCYRRVGSSSVAESGAAGARPATSLEEMRKARAAEVSFAMVWTPNPQQGQCQLARLDVVDALEDALNHPPR
eukprot:5441304-Prymnesium_polylepis.1